MDNTEQSQKENKSREWTTEEMFLLLDLYQGKPRLWNPSHKECKLKSKRNDDWIEISTTLNCDVNDIKKKIESLLTSFRRERQRCEASKKSGIGSDDIYNSKWFAFEKMKFLLDKFTPRVTIDTIDIEDESLDVSVGDNSTNTGKAVSIGDHRTNTSKVFKSPKRLKLDKNTVFSQRAEEAFNNMQQAVKRRNERDSSTTFGEYVANKHRNYSLRTKSVVEHLIADILFKGDMGGYESNYGFDAAQIHSSNSSDSTGPYFRTSSPAYQPLSTNPTQSFPLQQYNRPFSVENLGSSSNSGSYSSGPASKITVLPSVVTRPPSSSPENIIPHEEHNMILPEEENLLIFNLT